MTVLTILFEIIGPSIARLIFGQWLKTETIDDISSPIIDLIKKKSIAIIN